MSLVRYDGSAGALVDTNVWIDCIDADSRWHGSCFVFDERVSVGHGLVEVGEKE